jgi:hypothetical protein
MVGYISSYITTKYILYYKDDVIEFIIIPKIIYYNIEKVKDIVISLLSIEGNSQL